MTREEAIKTLSYIDSARRNYSHEEYVALEMAIKALEQEPCEDAISRAAAIKAMDDLEQEDIELYGCSIPEGFDGKRAIEALQSLPSVNPKTNPVHLIDEAKLLKAIDTWDKFGVDDTNSLFRLDNLSLPHYVPYMRYDDVVKCIKGMPSVTPKQKMGRWIPVSERLPDIHNYTKHYLVTLKRGGVFVAMFTETDGNSWWTYDDVIAWMPLPEPYKESEDKE